MGISTKPSSVKPSTCLPSAQSSVQHLRSDLQSVAAYAIQNSQGLVKLDAMENPYAIPKDLQKKLGQRLGAVALNRYPVACVEALKTGIAHYLGGLPPGYDLLLGNGSDEIIAMLSNSLQPQACVMAPVPSFVYYQMAAQQHRLDFVGVPLKENFELDMPALKQAIEKHQPSLIYLAYPNNPTANLPKDEDVHALMAMAPGFVVIDEAYTPFAERSFAPYLQRYPHMLLMRTFSKWGLAGLRIGYLIGPSQVVEQVNKLRPPYNISALNAEAALFALEHAPVFEAQAKAIVEQRAYLQQILSQWSQLRVFPSQANMLLVRVPNADDCFNALRAQGILVKNVSKMHPLLAGCLRITIGTPAENEQLLAVFEKSL